MRAFSAFPGRPRRRDPRRADRDCSEHRSRRRRHRRRPQGPWQRKPPKCTNVARKKWRHPLQGIGRPPSRWLPIFRHGEPHSDATGSEARESADGSDGSSSSRAGRCGWSGVQSHPGGSGQVKTVRASFLSGISTCRATGLGCRRPVRLTLSASRPVDGSRAKRRAATWRHERGLTVRRETLRSRGARHARQLDS